MVDDSIIRNKRINNNKFIIRVKGQLEKLGRGFNERLINRELMNGLLVTTIWTIVLWLSCKLLNSWLDRFGILNTLIVVSVSPNFGNGLIVFHRRFNFPPNYSPRQLSTTAFSTRKKQIFRTLSQDLNLSSTFSIYLNDSRYSFDQLSQKVHFPWIYYRFPNTLPRLIQIQPPHFVQNPSQPSTSITKTIIEKNNNWKIKRKKKERERIFILPPEIIFCKERSSRWRFQTHPFFTRQNYFPQSPSPTNKKSYRCTRWGIRSNPSSATPSTQERPEVGMKKFLDQLSANRSWERAKWKT